MYSDFDGTLLRELEHIDSTVTVLSTFNNGGLEVIIAPFFNPKAVIKQFEPVYSFRSFVKAEYFLLLSECES